MVRKRQLVEPSGPFAGFLGELWNIWTEDAARAVLLARYRWQDIPETIIQEADAIQAQAQAAQTSHQINEQVNLQLGMLGISPSYGGGSFGGGMDPGAAMFLMTMSVVRRYQGGPPLPATSTRLVRTAEAALRGQIDPVQALLDAAPPATRQELQMAAQLLQMAGAYDLFRLQAIIAVAFALPRARIPALLPEAVEEEAQLPAMGIRPEAEIRKWLSGHKDRLTRGQLTPLDVLNAFAFGGKITAEGLRAALAGEKKVAVELVLADDVRIRAEVELPEEIAHNIAEVPDAWFHEGARAAAKPVFVALCALSPDAYFENMIGACDSVLGAHEDALAHFDRALAHYADYLPARLNHASELISLQRNEEGLLELAKLSLLHSTEEEQQAARTARDKLDAFWTFILEQAKTEEDPERRGALMQIYSRVRQGAAELGVDLTELVWTPEEKQRNARDLLKLFQDLEIPLTDEQIEALETAGGTRSQKRGAAQ